MTYSLDDHTIVILDNFRTNGTAAEQRRATIILMGAADKPVEEIAEVVGLKESSVKSWLRKWTQEGIGIFPDELPSAAKPEPDEESGAESETEIEMIEDAIPGVTEPRLPLTLVPAIELAPDDPMSEAARKILFFHFEQMLAHEPGSRAGEDPEGVHDMRVATRRMRSALNVFAPFFYKKALKPYTRMLRKLAARLGAVRDLDVLIENAQVYAAQHPAADLTPLVDQWTVARDTARTDLFRLLDSKKFAQFVYQYHAFLTIPGAGAIPLPAPDEPVAYQVCHLAPRVIYEYYEQVRAYEPVLEGAAPEVLHALRIDFKRLRYTLEFFRSVLGTEIGSVIDITKRVQDHLGTLNDIAVLDGLLRKILVEFNTEYSGIPGFMRPDMSGVLAYAAAQRRREAKLLAGFPAVWAAFNSTGIKQALALSLAVL